MKIYDAGHAGKPVTASAERSQLRQENQFQGFFPKDLLDDLCQQPGCVGLRLYNTGQLAKGERQLIVVGVTEDGSELRLRRGKGYFISAADEGGSPQRQTKLQATRSVNVALNGRTSADVKRLRFTSFFSKNMVERLLAPQGGQAAAGLRFYVAPLEVAGKNLQTHLAVATSAALGNSPMDTAAHILSDLPCPGGVCAVVPPPAASAPESAAKSAAAPSIEPALDTNKYLLIWQRE